MVCVCVCELDMFLIDFGPKVEQKGAAESALSLFLQGPGAVMKKSKTSLETRRFRGRLRKNIDSSGRQLESRRENAMGSGGCERERGVLM